jgi:NAD(P)-dependent dehydrogenase (short-subunit alcohol dehydrogenase family)
VDLGLENKVVVITGSSQGIGRALANSYAQEGATIVLVARQEPTETIDLIKDKCRKFTVKIADVTKEAQIQMVVENVLRKYGKIDILVNNAGALREGFISDTSEELWDFIFSTNLKSVFFFSKAVSSSMMKRRSGCIINASSFAAIIPSAGHGAYAAAKSGVISLTKTLAGELGPYNIKVFAYVPGVIETNLTKRLISLNEAEIIKTISSGRIGNPDDIASVVVMMSSDLAGYVNGSIIEISGGKFSIQNIPKSQALAKID